MTTGTYITGINLPVPGTGGDTASVAANKIVVSLQAIDSHAHTGTDGRKLGVSSFTIDANISWNNYRIESLGSVTFQNVTTAPGIANNVYVKDGELWFRDNNTNNVQLTLNGVVNTAATGLIVGMSGSAAVNYLAGSNYFEFVDEDGGYADLKFGDLKLANANGSIINILTGAPTSGYDITLPNANPAANQFLMSNGTGVLSWQYAVISDNSTLGANKIPYMTSSTTMAAFDVLGNGQLLIGTGGKPALATLTQTVNQVLVENTSGAIRLYLPQNIHTGATPTFAGLTNTGNYTSTGNVAAVNGGFSGTLGVTGVVTLSNLAVGNSRVVGVDASGVLSAPYVITETNIANSVVKRDVSGNFAAGTVTFTNATINTALNTNKLGAASIAAASATITNLTASSSFTSSGGVSTDGVTSFKYKRLSASVSGGGGIYVNHGVTGTILSVVGIYTRTSDDRRVVIGTGSHSTSEDIINFNSITSTQIVFTGYASLAGTVEVVITYV